MGIPALIARMARIPNSVPLQNRRMYSVGVFGSLLCIASHLLYIVFFYKLRVQLMFYYNFFSLTVFAFVFWTVVRFQTRKVGMNALSLSMAIAEILLHHYLSVICVGWGAGFQYLIMTLVILPFLIMPPERFRIAIFMSVVTYSAFVVLDSLFKNTVPLYSITAKDSELLNDLNIFLAFATLGMTAYLFVTYVKKAEEDAAREFARAEDLLHNILPLSIAERLKADSSTIADGFECATVLFSDIVDFTKLSARLSPGKVVALLNDIFSRFDAIAERHGLEKIKTIGDAYMVACGVPEKCGEHATKIARFALDMLEEVKRYNEENGTDLSMRIGMNSGPVVAGVIGRKKFIYDLWGDAVNMASRMESHGLPGRIQVTESSRELLMEDYEFEDRGIIEVKGKGPTRAYLLKERIAHA